MKKNNKTYVDFGSHDVPINSKQNLVDSVFNKVADNYDLMNDLMSFGMHRFWKKCFLDWMAPRPEQTLLDLAGGSGDIVFEFFNRGGNKAILIDINNNMIESCKKRLKRSLNNNLLFINANAEKIPIADNSIDIVSIAFGLRNITNRLKTLSEIKRVLKVGGRFMCLEFSHVNSPFLKVFYKFWSKNFIPLIGEKITNDKESY